ncbi:MAG: hypothetical protein LBT54_03030, partial [Bifidobacteriaceae bacterium]|nr:hypothetical protein [Bifidobacteriaceae bacterium]
MSVDGLRRAASAKTRLTAALAAGALAGSAILAAPAAADPPTGSTATPCGAIAGAITPAGDSRVGQLASVTLRD